MANAEEIAVEVVLATPDRQRLVRLRMPEGATVADAIAESGIPADFPQLPVENYRTAVWGELAGPGRRLRDGDRVEILRPLEIDPRDERRRLADAGRFMGGGH